MGHGPGDRARVRLPPSLRETSRGILAIQLGHLSAGMAGCRASGLGSCAHCGVSIRLRHQGLGLSGVEPTRRFRASARISRSSQETAGSGSRGTLFTYPEGTLKG